MKKIALFLILLAWLTPPNAEPSSVFWDISGDSRMGLEEVICTLQSTAELRIDKKVGLPDALYVLKILAGSEGNAEDIAKGTHPILDYVWTINENAELLKVPK